MMNSLMESMYARQIDHIIGDKLEKGEQPMKVEKSAFWGVAEDESVLEFQQFSNKFASEVKESINLMSPGTE